MSAPAERVALRLAVRGFVAVLIVLAAIPAYLTLAPSWRPLAARLACATLLGAGCARVIRSVRGSIEHLASSALDAPLPRAQPPDLDERFLRLRDELVFSTRRRQYFETVLWPQLCRLAGADLPRPAARHGRRRDGPSLGALERLIATLEKRA